MKISHPAQGQEPSQQPAEPLFQLKTATTAHAFSPLYAATPSTAAGTPFFSATSGVTGEDGAAPSGAASLQRAVFAEDSSKNEDEDLSVEALAAAGAFGQEEYCAPSPERPFGILENGVRVASEETLRTAVQGDALRPIGPPLRTAPDPAARWPPLGVALPECERRRRSESETAASCPESIPVPGSPRSMSQSSYDFASAAGTAPHRLTTPRRKASSVDVSDDERRARVASWAPLDSREVTTPRLRGEASSEEHSTPGLTASDASSASVIRHVASAEGGAMSAQKDAIHPGTPRQLRSPLPSSSIWGPLKASALPPAATRPLDYRANEPVFNNDFPASPALVQRSTAPSPYSYRGIDESRQNGPASSASSLSSAAPLRSGGQTEPFVRGGSMVPSPPSFPTTDDFPPSALPLPRAMSQCATTVTREPITQMSLPEGADGRRKLSGSGNSKSREDCAAPVSVQPQAAAHPQLVTLQRLAQDLLDMSEEIPDYDPGSRTPFTDYILLHGLKAGWRLACKYLPDFAVVMDGVLWNAAHGSPSHSPQRTSGEKGPAPEPPRSPMGGHFGHSSPAQPMSGMQYEEPVNTPEPRTRTRRARQDLTQRSPPSPPIVSTSSVFGSESHSRGPAALSAAAPANEPRLSASVPSVGPPDALQTYAFGPHVEGARRVEVHKKSGFGSPKVVAPFGMWEEEELRFESFFDTDELVGPQHRQSGAVQIGASLATGNSSSSTSHSKVGSLFDRGPSGAAHPNPSPIHGSPSGNTSAAEPRPSVHVDGHRHPGPPESLGFLCRPYGFRGGGDEFADPMGGDPSGSNETESFRGTRSGVGCLEGDGGYRLHGGQGVPYDGPLGHESSLPAVLHQQLSQYSDCSVGCATSRHGTPFNLLSRGSATLIRSTSETRASLRAELHRRAISPSRLGVCHNQLGQSAAGFMPLFHREAHGGPSGPGAHRDQGEQLNSDPGDQTHERPLPPQPQGPGGVGDCRVSSSALLEDATGSPARRYNNDQDRMIYVSWIPKKARAFTTADKRKQELELKRRLREDLRLTGLNKVLLFPPKGVHCKLIFDHRNSAGSFLERYGGDNCSEETERWKMDLCRVYDIDMMDRFDKTVVKIEWSQK